MIYIKENIEKILIKHKENEGKKIEIELQIEQYEEELKHAGTVYQDTEVGVIEEMQFAGRGYEDVYCKTNRVSDKTSVIAMNYIKEQEHINKFDIGYLQSKIEELKAEEKKIDKKIVRVENWLDKITEEQKIVIKLFYIENKGKNWNKVLKEYSKEYKDITDRGLRKIRDKGIETILNIVNIKVP